MQELISVIIPVYNAEKYLKETIESVLEQTYQNIEVILVNHNSTDSSCDIIKKYQKEDSRVIVLELDINKGGPAYPRNEGLRIAQGTYIAFLDSDDVWMENKLEKQLFMLNQNDLDMIHTSAYIIDESSNIQGVFNNQRVFNFLKYIINVKNIIFYTNYININSVLIKNQDLPLFNEDINLVAMEDWKFWIDTFYQGKKIMFLDKKLLKYRIHTSSTSQRDSDIGYRKSLYLLSLVLVESKITLRHYFFGSLSHFIRIVLKKFGIL